VRFQAERDLERGATPGTGRSAGCLQLNRANFDLAPAVWTEQSHRSNSGAKGVKKSTAIRSQGNPGKVKEVRKKVFPDESCDDIDLILSKIADFGAERQNDGGA
jgi:hypothetical protein